MLLFSITCKYGWAGLEKVWHTVLTSGGPGLAEQDLCTTPTRRLLRDRYAVRSSIYHRLKTHVQFPGTSSLMLCPVSAKLVCSVDTTLSYP